MRIGIDITLLGAVYTGQHFYITSLLKEMFRIAREDTFILFTYGNSGRSDFAGSGNVEFVRMVSGNYNRIKRIFVQNTAMAGVAQKHELDAFFSPAFIQPVKTKGIRKVVTVHDLIYKAVPKTYKTLKNIYFDRMISGSLRTSDHVIAISENTKRDIIRYFKTPPEKVKVIHYGLDDLFKRDIPAEELERKKKELSLPEKYFVYIGTLEPRKNLPYALKNLDRYFETDPACRFLVYGWKGDLPSDVFRALNGMKHRQRVEFRGYISHDELPYIYTLSEGLIFVSLYEGFGLPPVEAAACGVPAYVLNRSSVKEVLGDHAFFIDDKEYGLYEALIENKANRSHAATSGFKVFARSYSWAVAAGKTLELIRGEKER